MLAKYVCTILPKTVTSKELILFKKCTLPMCICRAKIGEMPKDRGLYPAAYYVYKKITEQKKQK